MAEFPFVRATMRRLPAMLARGRLAFDGAFNGALGDPHLAAGPERLGEGLE